jgi:UTP--glucose-1-phosphate uridylyltransferase
VRHALSLADEVTTVTGMADVTKAVIPAAGLGTRFLPATKAIPKEMLPVVDKPAIQYVVEEAARAGFNDVLFITAAGKGAIEDHFAPNHELEATLEGNEAKRALLAQVQRTSSLASIHSVLQREPLGLGHAVLCAAEHVGNEPFAVMLGDDLIDERDDLLGRMVEVQQRLGGCVVALLEVPHEQIGLYGCAAVEPTDEDDVVLITGLVEKPSPDQAPSDLAIIGRYLLSPEIFEVLRTTAPGRGGEIQLTDGIESLIGRAGAGGPVHGVIFRGRRYDTGDKADYLKALVQLGCDRADLGAGFREWLVDFVASGRATGAPTDPIEP